MSDPPADSATSNFPWMSQSHTDVYPTVDPSSTSLSLAGKVVIVTGVGEGVGRLGIVPAVVKAAPRGLILVCRDADALAEVVKEVETMDPSLKTATVPTDISSATSVHRLMLVAQEQFGHADILVNNADAELSTGPVVSMSPEMWWREFETSSTGAYLITQAFVDQLPAAVHGTIVNVTLGSAYGVYQRAPGQRFAERLSRQLRGYEAIENKAATSISLHPGVQSTNTTHRAFEAQEQGLLNLVGGTLVRLCSETARWLHGRWVAAAWDMEKLDEEKGTVMEQGLLRIDVQTAIEENQAH